MQQKEVKIYAAFDEVTGEAVLSEHSVRGRDYICPECNTRLRVRDGVIVTKHFYHVNGQHCSGKASADLAYQIAKENYKRVGDWFNIPKYRKRNGGFKFEGIEESVKIKQIEFNVKVTALNEEGNLYHPLDSVMDVVITTEDERRWGLEFHKPGEGIKPDRVLKYRQDLQVEAVFSVGYSEKNQRWQIDDLIWDRQQDEASVRVFLAKLQRKLEKEQKKLGRLRGLSEEKTYYYDRLSQRYKVLNQNVDKYWFTLEIEELKLNMSCRYETFKNYDRWLSQYGKVKPSFQLVKALQGERQHYQLQKSLKIS